MLKLNVDGTSKGNSGLAGGGMVLRNVQGHVVLAAAIFYGINFKFRHVYREANKVADFLASYVVNSGSCSEFSEREVLPLAGRLLLQQDQGMMPIARLKRVLVYATGPELECWLDDSM
ncbi:unnamed protein product [Ilex paraguariensis]|uniref:RNase H type-1 domain-containing protein n=1 Tax=Ilex paraguariensis TaxID=185542 RepID=A0ABC8SLA0_9AQUA